MSTYQAVACVVDGKKYTEVELSSEREFFCKQNTSRQRDWRKNDLKLNPRKIVIKVSKDAFNNVSTRVGFLSEIKKEILQMYVAPRVPNPSTIAP